MSEVNEDVIYTPIQRVMEAATRVFSDDESAVCELLNGDDDSAIIATLFGLFINQLAGVAHYQNIEPSVAVTNLAMQLQLSEVLTESGDDLE